MKTLNWPAGNAVWRYRTSQEKVGERKLVVHHTETWNIFNPLTSKFQHLPIAMCFEAEPEDSETHDIRSGWRLE